MNFSLKPATLLNLFVNALVAILVASTAAHSRAQQPLPGRHTPAEKVITFDNLSKTIIPFVAPQKPTISITPALDGQWTMTFAAGKGALVFAKPVPHGQYTITITTPKQAPTTIQWNVLPSRLDAAVEQKLRATRCIFGKPIAFKSRLPAEATLPVQQFLVFYQFGRDRIVYKPYTEVFTGEDVPARARIIELGVAWQYPATGEIVPLTTVSIEPDQHQPSIQSNPLMQANGISQSMPKGVVELTITGISLDTRVPIDAARVDTTYVDTIRFDSNGKNPIKKREPRIKLTPVLATPAMVEFRTPLELELFGTSLVAYSAMTRDTSWKASATTVQLAGSHYDESTGSLSCTVRLQELAPAVNGLRGKISLRLAVSIVNRKAGMMSAPVSEDVVIPVSLRYDARKGWHDAPASDWSGVQPRTATLPTVTPTGKGDVIIVPLDGQFKRRLREELTPLPPKTAHIEEAEANCDASYSIRAAIQAGKPVEPSSTSCQIVAEYWKRVQNIREIKDVTAVCDARMIERGSSPADALLGVISWATEQYAWNSSEKPLHERFAPSDLQPVGTLSVRALASIPTNVFEQSTDPNNPGMIPVRGSIESTSYKTMDAYCKADLGKHIGSRRYATALRNANGDVIGIRDVQPTISAMTAASEVTLVALDHPAVVRFRETFTPTLQKTAAIEQAEVDCPSTAAIKEYIQKKRPVPQSLLDEAPTECEIVKIYYKLLYETISINAAFAVIKREGRTGFTLLGTLAALLPEKTTLTDCWAEQGGTPFLYAGALTTEELRSFRTKEYEPSTDPNAPNRTAVRGSIELASQETMAAYIHDFVERRLREGLGIHDSTGLGVQCGKDPQILDVVNLRAAQR